MSDKLYALLDKENKVLALTRNTIEAQRLKDNYGKVVKVKKSLASKIEDIPEEKELVEMYDYILSRDEEQEVVDLCHDAVGECCDAIENFDALIKFLKLTPGTECLLQEYNNFLLNELTSLEMGCDEAFHDRLFGDKLAQVRYHNR